MPDRMRRPHALIAAIAFAGVGLTATAGAAPANHGEVLGMSAILMREADYSGPDDCPEIGPSSTETWLKQFATPEQRTRLTSKTGDDDELQTLANNSPGYSDLCSAPTARLLAAPTYPKPYPVQGKKAYGLNLDGTTDGHATSKSCTHKKFEGLSGEGAVDNELYRVLGCQKFFRWETRTSEAVVKDVYDYDGASHGNKALLIGQETTLLQISGVDDRMNDPEVWVLLASGETGPIVGQNNRPVSWTTQVLDRDPMWQVKVKGRIKDGILTTDSFDFKLKRRDNGPHGWYEMRGARMRLQLTPDGGAKGVIAGYTPIEGLFWFRPAYYGRGLSQAGKLNCPAWYKALADAADGYPDPDTGQCTAISSAYAVEFIPAFVVPSEAKTADATPAGD